ncbi:MAG TPA: proline iminopeptidase-family hydrolase [Rhizomicrobium sp.]|nr:proline iminopeptidase-family hydrolase [Rhizomicrobium sp.]
MSLILSRDNASFSKPHCVAAMRLTRRAALAALACAPLAAHAAGARIPDRTGFARVPGGRVWWRRLGEGSKPPLLLLHGGPGMGHDYLLPLAALAGDREVIFYDQFGCARSDAPDDPSLYTIAKFAGRVEALRDALKLDRIALYGHSWGGILAIEYLTSKKRRGVETLILSNALASARQANDGLLRLIGEMPGGGRLLELERAREYAAPEYASLVQDFDDLHFCRADPKPPEFEASMQNAIASPSVPVMVGNGLSIDGNLKHWDRRADLPAIDMPTLIVTGEFDEVTRDCQQTLRDAIPGASLAVMPGCSHMTMTEAPAAYNAILSKFLG